MSRFSQAISEGDGISVIPMLEGDVAELAALAEEAGAEAVAVLFADADRAQASTSLPVAVVGGVYGTSEAEALANVGADGWIVVLDPDGERELLDELYPVAAELGVDCAVEVWDDERLTDALEQIDPEIIVIAHPGDEEEELEYILDLLPAVPAGKLVIARPRRPVAREQVVALERAGVDAILVGAGFLRDPDFAGALAELTGRAEA